VRVLLQQLTKRFGTVTAVDAFDLETRDGEFVALLGPSGCGKTTTLLMIAGIYRPTSGAIFFGERRVDHLLPKERGIGMVFQSYALYPHMTVAENIGFPLELRRGIEKSEREARVREAAELVRVAELLARRPSQLSGGQQQRVALARALVKRPDILLLDEPLSNLDARLRHAMRGEIKRLQKEINVTSIFVTHDQVEALTMADRVAVMHLGRLAAFDTPEELYAHPRSLFVAEFIGTPPMNLIPCGIAERDGALAAISNGLAVTLPPATQARLRSEGTARDLTVGIRPEHLALVAPGAGQLGGEIYVSEPLGREQIVDVRAGEHIVKVIAPSTFQGKIGEHVGLDFDPHRVHVFDSKSGERLG